MTIGKERRLKRIYNPSGKMIVVPLDHGVTLGSVSGISDMEVTLKSIVDHGCDAVVLHKGMIRQYSHLLLKPDLGVFLHVSGSTNLGQSSNHKVLLSSVEDAIMLGCDGVSIQVNLGGSNEPEMLKDFGIISSECYKMGMPLLAMVYNQNHNAESIKHTIRIAVELGADLVKVRVTDDSEEFSEVVNNSAIPVLVGGGEKMNNPNDFIHFLCNVMKTNVAGTSIGRNVFQSKSLDSLLCVMKKVVYEHMSYEEGIQLYERLTLRADLKKN